MVRAVVGRVARKANLRTASTSSAVPSARIGDEGVPVRTIQGLAGHQHLPTAVGYMHVSPASRTWAIRVLDVPQARGSGGGGGSNRGE